MPVTDANAIHSGLGAGTPAIVRSVKVTLAPAVAHDELATLSWRSAVTSVPGAPGVTHEVQSVWIVTAFVVGGPWQPAVARTSAVSAAPTSVRRIALRSVCSRRR